MNPMPTGFEAAPMDLLRAAFWDDAQALPAWQRWRDSVDWEAHLEADAFALLPLVYRNLRRLGGEDALFPRLKGIARQSWLRNQRRLQDLEATLSLLESTPIEIVFLPPTSRWLTDATWVQPGTEPYRWAVPPEQAETAIRALLAAGWHPTEVHLWQGWLAGFVRGARHLVLRREQDDQGLVLSWGLEHAFAERGKEAWGNSRPSKLGAHSVRALHPTDAAELVLRWPTAATWLGRLAEVLAVQQGSDPIDWRELSRRFRQRPLAEVWREPLCAVAPLLGDGSLPSTRVEAWCAPQATPGEEAFPPPPWWTRFRQDWRIYRSEARPPLGSLAALVQLPGYLMGRWALTRPHQLLRGLRQWTRFQGEKSGPAQR